jgi:hypothetical protein
MGRGSHGRASSKYFGGTQRSARAPSEDAHTFDGAVEGVAVGEAEGFTASAHGRSVPAPWRTRREGGGALDRERRSDGQQAP